MNDAILKICSKCGEEKPLACFSKSGAGRHGVQSQCKQCLLIIARLRRADKNWRDSEFGRMEFGCILEPGEVRTEKRCNGCHEVKPVDEFYACRKGRLGVKPVCKECERASAVVRRAADVQRAREYGRSYYAANREKLLKAANDNLATPRGKIDNAISSGVMRGIRKGSKNGRRSFELLGYSLEQLMTHLEAQFEPWMNWSNYGFYGWHIDHIKPLASFNYETPDDPEFKQAWAMGNLRPLRSTDNWRKGAKYEADNDNGKTANAEGEGGANRPRAA